MHHLWTSSHEVRSHLHQGPHLRQENNPSCLLYFPRFPAHLRRPPRPAEDQKEQLQIVHEDIDKNQKQQGITSKIIVAHITYLIPLKIRNQWISPHNSNLQYHPPHIVVHQRGLIEQRKRWGLIGPLIPITATPTPQKYTCQPRFDKIGFPIASKQLPRASEPLRVDEGIKPWPSVSAPQQSATSLPGSPRGRRGGVSMIYPQTSDVCPLYPRINPHSLAHL